jgi:NADH dehydrogenase [ubiquinone] 1 alpha subcomplex assembly factor 2
MRRIVQYPASTHYSDIKISPQWHQWLRHTRSDPPSLGEQSQDIIRQQNLKVLAAEADARWAAKPSFLDSPGQARGQPFPSLEAEDPGDNATETESENRARVKTILGGEQEAVAKRTDISASSVEKGEQEGKMQIPDCIKHHFNEKPKEEKRPKKAGDPWKQHHGGENWQPAAWDGNIAVRR